MKTQIFIELDQDDLDFKINQWREENNVQVVNTYHSLSYSSDFHSNVYGATIEYIELN